MFSNIIIFVANLGIALWLGKMSLFVTVSLVFEKVSIFKKVIKL